MASSSSAAKPQSVDRPPSRGGRLDGRLPIARRRRELIDVYATSLGGAAVLSEGQLLDIRRAAELTALAEQARAKAMREGAGDAAELSAMIRLESTAARAVRALNIRPGANQPKPKSLADHIAERVARAAGSGGAPPA